MTPRDIVIVVFILAGCVFMLRERDRHRAPAGCLCAHARGQSIDRRRQRPAVGGGSVLYDEFLMLRMLALIALIFATAPSPRRPWRVRPIAPTAQAQASPLRRDGGDGQAPQTHRRRKVNDPVG